MTSLQYKVHSGRLQVFLRLLAVFVFSFHPTFGEVIDLSLPKCANSLLGNDAEIPSILISSQDLKDTTSQTISVKLEEKELLCDSEKGRVSSLQVSYPNSHDITEVLTLFRSGYMLHDTTYYSDKEFCVQSITQNGTTFTISANICEARCASDKYACIRKCCEPGKVWSLENYHRGSGKLSCENPGAKKWEPTLYQNRYVKVNRKKDDIKTRYMNFHPTNFCNGGFFLITLREYDEVDATPFRILRDGTVSMKVGRNSWEEVPSSSYCIDGAMNFKQETKLGEDPTFSGDYSGYENDTVMLVCTSFLDDPDEASDGSTNLLYVIAMLVSSVFLFLTAVVYAILWKRQNVHGWTFLGYILSLLMTFVFLSTAHLLSSGDYDCFFVGIACHFFFLSTFAWLTTLNFDIYWTFRSLNPNPGRRKEIIRFLCYAVFAIGVPVIIVSVGLILDEIYGDDPESEVIVPRYGVTRCTMDRSADLPYLFGPISVLLCCNLILFPTTLFYIHKSQKITKLSGMKSNILKHKIRFFGKLFMLAGITWIFEVVSWACTRPGGSIHWIWKFLDLVNILQAIAIFAVFVCNRKTLQELSEKFPCLKRLNSIMVKASGVAANSTRRPSNTHVSSIFDAPGLDTVELS